MKNVEEYLREYQEEDNRMSGKNVDYKRMIPYTTATTLMHGYARDMIAQHDKDKISNRELLIAYSKWLQASNIEPVSIDVVDLFLEQNAKALMLY